MDIILYVRSQPGVKPLSDVSPIGQGISDPIMKIEINTII